MKIACCILCHEFNNTLERLVDKLYKEFDLYVHVDEKSNIDEFAYISGKVHFTKIRYKIYWGSFNMVKAELELFKIAKDLGYDYILLLSGDDYPIKNVKFIKSFIEQNSKKELIDFAKGDNERQLYYRTYYKYYKFVVIQNKNKVQKVLNSIYHKYRYLFINRYYYKLPKLYKGSQWIGFSKDFCQYIFEYLNKNPEYLKAFEHSFASDEMFFQTILMDSHFKNDTYNFSSLRYIDWEGGGAHPKMLDESDFTKLKKSSALFARKISPDIDFNELDNYLEL